MVRTDYRDRIKNKLALLSSHFPDIFPDSEINSAFLDTLRNLPYKGVYKQEKWEKTLTINEKEYALPSDHLEAEKVQIDEGNVTLRSWIDQQGWEEFGGVLHLAYAPSQAKTMRVWAKMKFTEVTNDVAAVDVPDDKSEVVVLGSMRRLLENLINYMVDSANYDSVVKPSGATLPQVKNWRDEIRVEEERLIKSFKKVPQVREMNLTT